MTVKSDTTPVQEIVRKLPEKPGVYQFLGISGDMLYVGKAKNLKKRVASYFTRSDQHNYKHEVLVKKIEVQSTIKLRPVVPQHWHSQQCHEAERCQAER